MLLTITKSHETHISRPADPGAVPGAIPLTATGAVVVQGGGASVGTVNIAGDAPCPVITETERSDIRLELQADVTEAKALGGAFADAALASLFIGDIGEFPTPARPALTDTLPDLYPGEGGERARAAELQAQTYADRATRAEDEAARLEARLRAAEADAREDAERAKDSLRACAASRDRAEARLQCALEDIDTLHRTHAEHIACEQAECDRTIAATLDALHNILDIKGTAAVRARETGRWLNELSNELNALASRRAALRGREVPPPPEAGALALTTWLYGALRGREVPPPPEAE